MIAAAERAPLVVHVVQHLRPGGIEALALEMSRVQAEAGCRVRIVSLEGDAGSALRDWPRLAAFADRLTFANKRPGFAFGLVPELARLFRAERPDCVHTHHVGPLLYAGAAARLAGVRRRVHTEHDAWHLRDARRRRVVSFALAAARPSVVADAAHVASAFAAALGRPVDATIPNGVDTGRFAPRGQAGAAAARALLGLPEGRPIVGVSARLEEVKGVDLALRALAFPEARDLFLAVAGRGSRRDELEALAADLGVRGRVAFLGHVDDMADFYAALDALCLPSRDEGMPLSLLEAQACGVPVAAFAVGGVPAAVDPATGILVPSGDSASMGAAMRDAANSSGDPRPFVERSGSLVAARDAYARLYGKPFA